jgi:hypothetical protein
MKKVLLGLLAVLVLAVVVLLGLASTKPDTLAVSRSVVVQASPADVLPYAQDYTHFVKWIPWTALDPQQTVEFSDPPSGVGAWYTWKGNSDVGQGKMTILAVSLERVDSSLEFIEPFASKAASYITMVNQGQGQTEITWGFEQDNDLMGKLMMVFVDMDAMLGADFQKGLDSLKPMVEQAASERLAAEAAAEAAAKAEAERLAAEAAAMVDEP